MVVLLDKGQLSVYPFDLLFVIGFRGFPFPNVLVLFYNSILKPFYFLLEPFNFSQISLVLSDGFLQPGYFLFKLMNLELFSGKVAPESAEGSFLLFEDVGELDIEGGFVVVKGALE